MVPHVVSEVVLEANQTPRKLIPSLRLPMTAISCGLKGHFVQMASPVNYSVHSGPSSEGL